MLNIKEDILKIGGNQIVDGPHWLQYISFPTMEVNGDQQLFGSSTFFKISSFVLNIRNKRIQVCNDRRASKWWQHHKHDTLLLFEIHTTDVKIKSPIIGWTNGLWPSGILKWGSRHLILNLFKAQTVLNSVLLCYAFMLRSKCNLTDSWKIHCATNKS